MVFDAVCEIPDKLLHHEEAYYEHEGGAQQEHWLTFDGSVSECIADEEQEEADPSQREHPLGNEGEARGDAFHDGCVRPNV